MQHFLLAATVAATLVAAPAAAQDHATHDQQTPPPAPAPETPAMDHGHHHMPGMDMGTPDSATHAPPANAGPGTGTSLVPAAEGGMRGIHLTTGDWMVMAHGFAMLGYTDQGGPRGDDAAFTSSMAMLSASRTFDSGVALRFSSMFSLDPVNGKRGYPNLFGTGETANGLPLVDRQHPHDFFMELAARVDVPLARGVTGFVYGGPVAEPALGPSAFMHRRSARYLPLSPITHHWFDSSHVTFGVVTAGVATGTVQLEGSAFRGREPDEQRWDIETPRLDSWSLRATFTPSPNWAFQVSHGRLESPESTHIGEDERRTTASAQYARGGFSAMLAFAAKDRVPGQTLTAWLGEANWDLTRHHSIFGRVENVANDELFPDHASPLHDRAFRVTRFEGGYAYRIPLARDTELALGGTLATYVKPAILDAAYGKAPLSYTVFARLALGQ
ncbi:hypothetical protein ACG3SL_02620 [Sphingomonas sp. CJ20]